MDKVRKYMKDGQLPEDHKEVKRIRHKLGWFMWHGDQLYKKSFTHALLKCVSPKEEDYILRETYEGACGSHQGGRTVARKFLKAGYY